MDNERRSEERRVLDFSEFPMYGDFFSGKAQHFHGHIQNISSSGLCVMLMNSNIVSEPNTKGNLHIVYRGKSVSVPATVRWTDEKKHFIRYAGIEVQPKLLVPKLKDLGVYGYQYQ